MLWLLIEGQTLDIIILLAGLLSLLICSSRLFIVMNGCVSIKLSKICLLDRNMRNQLLEILDTNVIFLGETIFPTANTYSFCGMPSIELKTIVWSLDGVLSFAVIVANVISLLLCFGIFRLYVLFEAVGAGG